jgi:hypothetical protein
MAEKLGLTSEGREAFVGGLGPSAIGRLEDTVTASKRLGSHLDERLATFEVDGSAVPLTRVEDGAFFDIGPANPSESVLAAVLPPNRNKRAIAAISKATGIPLDATNCALVFASRRFVEATDDHQTSDLVVGYAEQLIAFKVDGRLSRSS